MITLLVVGLALATGAPAAQPFGGQPTITNGRVMVRPAGVLPQTFGTLIESGPDVFWIGYGARAIPGDRDLCCHQGGAREAAGICCARCRLDPDQHRAGAASPQPQTSSAVRLEAGDELIVLFRIAERRVDRVRVFSGGCPLDAGGRDVFWLMDVPAQDSLAHLADLVLASRSGRSDRRLDGAISAVALHADPSADRTLARFADVSQPESLRTRVPFWLGHARGSRGLDLLEQLVQTDPSPAVMKKAVFGISQSREPRALDVLITTARTNGSPAVRGEALFWLAQKAGSKAADAITERLEHDPDIDVKKRAVFALSQLPADEGVPLLIDVARGHPNPAVKKQAIFWLGQSRDPRALDLFADILR